MIRRFSHRAGVKLKEIGMRPKRLDACNDLARQRPVGKIGGRIGHITLQIEAAALDVAGRDQHSSGVNAGMHLQWDERTG